MFDDCMSFLKHYLDSSLKKGNGCKLNNIGNKLFWQAAAIRFELRGGEWKDAFLQMDGEPWKQPMSNEFSTFVEIKRVPCQSLMISGE